MSAVPETLRGNYIPLELRYESYEEKRTDVNIAVAIVSDAYNNKYDKAILLTADSDISPSIKEVKKHFPDKEFLLVLPMG